MTASTQERLSEARNQVLQASRLLVSPAPESLDRCALLLKTAITPVAACHAELTAAPDAISMAHEAALEEARRLQRAIGLIKLLLNTALNFHHHWSKRLGMMTCGYTASGEAAPVEHGSRILGRG